MSKKLEIIKEKSVTEAAIIDHVLNMACGKIDENERLSYSAFWAAQIGKRTNVVFDTGITDETQVYRVAWCEIPGSELNANIDYLSAYIGAASDRYKRVEIERSGGELRLEGIRVISSNLSSTAAKQADAQYPVLITLMPDGVYLVIDGNHRVNAGENSAVIVPPQVFIKSLATLYEVYMYMIHSDICDYLKRKLSVKEIIERDKLVLASFFEVRKMD